MDCYLLHSNPAHIFAAPPSSVALILILIYYIICQTVEQMKVFNASNMILLLSTLFKNERLIQTALAQLPPQHCLPASPDRWRDYGTNHKLIHCSNGWMAMEMEWMVGRPAG